MRFIFEKRRGCNLLSITCLSFCLSISSSKCGSVWEVLDRCVCVERDVKIVSNLTILPLESMEQETEKGEQREKDGRETDTNKKGWGWQRGEDEPEPSGTHTERISSSTSRKTEATGREMNTQMKTSRSPKTVVPFSTGLCCLSPSFEASLP